MSALKVGIFDSDRAYVEKMAAYLNRFGKEIWNVAGFTDGTVLEKYMRERGVDLLMMTGKDSVAYYKGLFPEVCCVCLTESKREGKGRDPVMEGVYSVYRYQSAGAVGQAVVDIVKYLGIVKQSAKKSVALYSPVGRCGKTTLAMEFVENEQNAGWLYIGMEDYSYLVDDDKYAAEDFLYYVKERREDAVSDILNKVSGIIPSPFSPFDTRQIGRNDVEWFLKIFENIGIYKGVIFDIGTGILQNLNVLLQFDYLIVPYLSEEPSMEKRQQFEELIRAYEMDELLERIHYLNMDDPDVMRELIEVLE